MSNRVSFSVISIFLYLVGTAAVFSVYAENLPSAYVDPVTGMQFVLIEGGCFEMGDTFKEGDADEQPIRTVCPDSFYLAIYEVTQKQWHNIMGYNHSYFKEGDDYPVEEVNWSDVQKFIQKLNKKSGTIYRLPTGAEWEYACRQKGKKVRYGNGKNQIDPEEANYNGHHTFGDSAQGVYRKKTTSAGSFVPNSLGIYDMSGNVWEWISDRSIRGGSWYAGPYFVRCANRGNTEPVTRGNNLGFRLAKTP